MDVRAFYDLGYGFLMVGPRCPMSVRCSFPPVSVHGRLPVPVVDGVVAITTHIVQGARYVNVGPSSLLSAVIRASMAYSNRLLDTVRQRDDSGRLPVDPPVEGCSDPDLIDVLLERHGGSGEHGRVWCVHDAYGHLLALEWASPPSSWVTGHEPGTVVVESLRNCLWKDAFLMPPCVR